MMSDETDKHDLRARTKRFALRIIRLCATLQKRGAEEIIARQLLRCGTSVGAQYREACRARSKAEFISKLESTTQEMDETMYWLELLVEANLVPSKRLALLQKEANELMSIFVASVRTAKRSRS
jgi:four helix bundle protein